MVGRVVWPCEDGNIGNVRLGSGSLADTSDAACILATALWNLGASLRVVSPAPMSLTGAKYHLARKRRDQKDSVPPAVNPAAR
jgi:hypothetical protein